MKNSGVRNLILVCAIVVLAAAGAAQAQDKVIQPIGPPIPFNQTISIEDDVDGSFVVFDTGSGKYKFVRCNDGFTISGVGFVKVDGCSIFLEDLQAEHRVVVSANECDQQAKAVVEKFAPVNILPGAGGISLFEDATPFKAFLSDVNIGNNLMDCAPKKAPKTKK